MRDIEITKAEANQRLDKFLLKYLNKAPKSFIYKMLRKKNIKYNSAKAEGSEILAAGDIITLFLSDETLDNFAEQNLIKKSHKPIDIIYEDENLLIINKPVGLLSQPEKASDTDTLISRVLYYLHEKGIFSTEKFATFTPALCNRLDRNTSGLVVCGKNLAALQAANKMFSENKIEKYYKTIVMGEIKKSGSLRDYYIKDENKNMGRIVPHKTEATKEIITEYSPVLVHNGATLLNVKLITGKSHQIRLHLKSISHPILGDSKYGNADINAYIKKKFGIRSQLLHCGKIIIKADTGLLQYLYNKEFTAEPPKIFEAVMKLGLNMMHY